MAQNAAKDNGKSKRLLVAIDGNGLDRNLAACFGGLSAIRNGVEVRVA
jgi:hypothetical protein